MKVSFSSRQEFSQSEKYRRQCDEISDNGNGVFNPCPCALIHGSKLHHRFSVWKYKWFEAPQIKFPVHARVHILVQYSICFCYSVAGHPLIGVVLERMYFHFIFFLIGVVAGILFTIGGIVLILKSSTKEEQRVNRRISDALM